MLLDVQYRREKLQRYVKTTLNHAPIMAEQQLMTLLHQEAKKLKADPYTSDLYK